MPVNNFDDYPMNWRPKKSQLKRPVYQSLAELLEHDIANGVLLPGTKIPPQRELADYLDINFTTVTRAYKICELKGLIYARSGSGTFIAQNAAQSITISTDDWNHNTIDMGFVSSFEQCNIELAEIIKKVSQQKYLVGLLDYRYPTGMPKHKEAAIEWLKRLGLDTDEEHIAIVSGAQNGIALTLLSLFEQGDRIAVDEYTYANFIELAKMNHIQLVPIAGDDQGMSAEELEKQYELLPFKGVYLMPSCSNPTTVIMSQQRKEKIASVIKKYNLILIEDDIHAFMTAGVITDYKGPIAKIIPENSIYISGTSKPLCSGLRVAYIVYPEKFKSQIEKAIFNVNVKTSSFDAEVISELILSGKAYTIIEKKKQLLICANKLFYEYFPEIKNQGHPLSFFRWIPVSSHLSGKSIEKQLLLKGIRVYHSDRFHSNSKGKRNYLRISLSTAHSIDELRNGLIILKKEIGFLN